MADKFTSFCVALILVLASASAARRRLNSISELIAFHQNDHTNILELLYWFANQVYIDGNIIWLTFDPNSEYGSHPYRNFERLLDFPREDQYYTVGNVHKETSRPLPSYVIHSPRANNGWNRARIIIRVRGGNTASQNHRIIDRVFITQHYGTYDDHGTNYDPDHTYEVSTSLLREFRGRKLNEIQQLADRSRRGNFGYTPISQGYYIDNQHGYKPSLQGYTFSANTTRATNDDDCQVCLVISCIVVILLVVIGFFFLRPFLGNMKI